MKALALALALAAPVAPAAARDGSAELPAGTPLQIILESTLDSRTAREGDAVRARLAAPVTAAGATVVPAGAALAGRVTKVSGPQVGLMKAKIEFSLDRLQTRRGTVPIEASAHFDVTDLAMKGGKMAGTMAAKEVAKRAVPVLGTVFLIQDAARAINYLQEEKEIVIPRGTRLTVRLDRPARVPL
ncbi:MAG: hypothetical protein PHN82_01810 [bacterium]|nr:hypothetical protein [bacterium]